MNNNAIYMDNAATTPVRTEVVEAVSDAMLSFFGNASSMHATGQRARKALEEAREKVAACIGADPDEVVFTSGGTESDNLAVRGATLASGLKGSHLVTTKVEHPAVLNCCRSLEEEGFSVTYLPVDRECLVDTGKLEDTLGDDTVLVSCMLANNETGTLQPVAGISEIARPRGILVHADAVQAVGKVPVDVRALGVDMLSISGHKLNGPKGVGALYVRRGTELHPLLYGGHHERGLRPGTENIPGAVGLALALELAVAELPETGPRLRRLKDRLSHGLLSSIEGVSINGVLEFALPNILNVTFECVDGESLLLGLDLEGIAVSTGSACSSGSADPSHVLLAMARSPQAAQGSIRFSLGRDNTGEDVERVCEVLPSMVERLRSIAVGRAAR